FGLSVLRLVGVYSFQVLDFLKQGSGMPHGPHRGERITVLVLEPALALSLCRLAGAPGRVLLFRPHNCVHPSVAGILNKNLILFRVLGIVLVQLFGSGTPWVVGLGIPVLHVVIERGADYREPVSPPSFFFDATQYWPVQNTGPNKRMRV